MTFGSLLPCDVFAGWQSCRPQWLISLFLWTALAGTATAADNDAAQAEAQRLVVAAAQAEIAGDVSRFLSLLHEALRSDPDNQIARWQLGQVRLNGNWVTVEEAQRRAAADPLQAEYRQRRAAAGPSARDQLAVARWCRDNKLGDEADLHWAVVLSLDPTNKEALRAVDMLWKDGRLVNRNETAQQKQQVQAAKNAAKRWEPIIAKWRRAVGGRDVQAHDAALAEIRAINELDAIPSLEAVTLGRDAYDMKHAEECLQIAVAFLDALEKMLEQAAAEAIVRHAVLSPGNKARRSAIEKLKARDEHDYVPMLMSGLAMPIESSFNVRTNSDGSVHYTHTLYREGQNSDWSYDLRRSAIQNDLGGRRVRVDTFTDNVEIGPPSESPLDVMAKKAMIASAHQKRYGQNAIATEEQVARTNRSIDEINSRIVPVLAGTTGQAFGENPKAWWDWWRSRNEYYEGEHPVDQHYDSDSDHYYYGYPKYELYSSAPPDPRFRGLSCFASGTPVWTKTGQKPIETVGLGDFVLSQDVNTGELKYKPVIAKTVRPPSPMLKLALENDRIVTTLGHPFWVAGVGWRMAKELGDDAKLHGVTGSTRIRAIESAPDAEAYNLVVADFNTYFVGETGVLVHDNTPRRPTQAVVPGLAAK